MARPTHYDFEEGAVLVINKPLHWSSFQVVSKVRLELCRKLKIKTLKVGHAGTLDPMATGILLICTGKMTKRADELQAERKIYTGIIRIGATTPSYDTEHPEDAFFPTAHITPELLHQAKESLSGEILQMPPVYSAIKKDGKRLYESARAGESVEVQARPVSIYRFELSSLALPDIDFEVECSKGTYIRSLAHDFGKALHSGAYLRSLCRTASGNYHINEAWNLEELLHFIQNT